MSLIVIKYNVYYLFFKLFEYIMIKNYLENNIYGFMYFVIYIFNCVNSYNLKFLFFVF